MVALVTFLHGLRVSELIDLRWDDIDWRKGTIAIRRLKGSIDGTHYLERDEAIGLKRLQREQEPKRPHIFTSERGEAFSRFAINKMIGTAGQNAKITWPVHPHCLRHTTGTMQANGGMDAWRLSKLMGHASIANTTKYVRMSPGAVEGCLARKTLITAGKPVGFRINHDAKLSILPIRLGRGRSIKRPYHRVMKGGHLPSSVIFNKYSHAQFILWR